jgi:hypothetical protein
MSPLSSRRRPNPRRAGAIVLSALALVTAGQFVAPMAAGAVTTTVAPGANLDAAFERLRPGDTLLLSPGTYNVGTLRPVVARGTANARITVKAQDPAHKPLLRGWLRLERPDYWTFSGLRMQATLAAHEAIDIFGGRSWSIEQSEVFGAKQTGAYANIALYSYPSSQACGVTPAAGCENPYGWSITSNCVHDAGPGTAANHGPSTDHNIYLTGTGYAPGRISRNILFSAQHGSQIKIGDPASGSGFSGVSVDHNTMHASAQGVLIAGKGINHTYVRYNLIKTMSPPTATGVGAGIYLDAPRRALRSGEIPNYAIHNYGAGIRTSTLYLSASGALPGTHDEADNPTANSAGADPKFNAGGCSGYRPGNAIAARYGRYSTYFGSGY